MTASSEWPESLLRAERREGGGGGEGSGGLRRQQKPFSCLRLVVRLVGLGSVGAAVNPSNSHGNTELSQTMT